jgi:hypothetical protein
MGEAQATGRAMPKSHKKRRAETAAQNLSAVEKAARDREDAAAAESARLTAAAATESAARAAREAAAPAAPASRAKKARHVRPPRRAKAVKAARAASTPAGRMLGKAVQKTIAKPGAKAPPAPRRGADYRYPPIG